MKWQFDRFYRGFETAIVRAILLMLMFTVLIGTLQMLYILVVNTAPALEEMTDVVVLQDNLRAVFSASLLIMLGIELMETMRHYFSTHTIRVEVVFAVAMIAVGRHVIELDILHTDALTLIGIAAVLIALASGYFLLRSAREKRAVSEARAVNDSQGT